MVFHELAHYSHFYQAGQFAYWRGVAKGTLNAEKGYGYGSGTQIYASYVAVAEAWAHYIGYYLADKELGSSFYTTKANTGLEGQKPRQTPVDKEDGISWIPYGLMYDVFDDTPDENVRLYDGNGISTGIVAPDVVKDLSPAMLYQQLTGEVTSIPQLKDKLTTAYPAYNNEQFTHLFKAYGY